MGVALVVNGRWRSTGEDLCIINIYTSCNAEEKQLLWDGLSIVIEQNSKINLCLIGDFNSILHECLNLKEVNKLGTWETTPAKAGSI